jgi:hypothetical protein
MQEQWRQTCACEGGALEGGEGCGVYDTELQRGGWSCSWGNTARLGGPPREALYTVALRGVR